MIDTVTTPISLRVLRNLLDAKSRSGLEFRDDEAALDLLLAHDRNDVKPERYYAKRWHWTQSDVHRKKHIIIGKHIDEISASGVLLPIRDLNQTESKVNQKSGAYDSKRPPFESN